MNIIYYNNKFIIPKNKKQIIDIDKLYEGQLYLLDMNRAINCGPLIKKTINISPYKTTYNSIYFKVGTAKYDGINMNEQIHQYHIQSQVNLSDIKLKIYDYVLDNSLQYQIKNYWYCKYCKKTVYNLCNELNISEDIEKMIQLFLIK